MACGLVATKQYLLKLWVPLDALPIDAVPRSVIAARLMRIATGERVYRR